MVISLKNSVLAGLLISVLGCGISKGSREEGPNSGASDQQVETKKFGNVEINSNSAKLFFNIDQSNDFKWDMGAKGKLEWEWRGVLIIAKTKYQIGFSRESRGGSSNTGTLSELLAGGDYDVRIPGENEDKDNIVSNNIEISLLDDGLVMEVLDDSFLNLWRGEKPEKISLHMTGSLQNPPIQVVVPITYK